MDGDLVRIYFIYELKSKILNITVLDSFQIFLNSFKKMSESKTQVEKNIIFIFYLQGGGVMLRSDQIQVL